MLGNNAGNSIRKEGNKRDSYFQAIRGICILMVIYIHSAAGDKGAPWELNYWIAVRQFCSIAVALFLVLSGYFSADSIGGGRAGTGNCSYLICAGLLFMPS